MARRILVYCAQNCASARKNDGKNIHLIWLHKKKTTGNVSNFAWCSWNGFWWLMADVKTVGPIQFHFTTTGTHRNGTILAPFIRQKYVLIKILYMFSFSSSDVFQHFSVSNGDFIICHPLCYQCWKKVAFIPEYLMNGKCPNEWK